MRCSICGAKLKKAGDICTTCYKAYQEEEDLRKDKKEIFKIRRKYSIPYEVVKYTELYIIFIISAILPEADVSVSSTLQVGDKITQVGEKKIRIKNDLTKGLEGFDGGEIDVTIDRDGEEHTFTVTPVQYMDENYILGVQVALAEDGTIQERLYYSFWETLAFIGDMFHNIKQLLVGELGIDKLAGPIGISNIIAESNSWYDFLYLLAFISVSLGITNFLPIPALDGGKMILLVVEGIRGKPLSEKVEEKIQSFGFLLLIGLAIFVSINDLIRLLKTLI